jgi:O-antigen ligase
MRETVIILAVYFLIFFTVPGLLFEIEAPKHLLVALLVFFIAARLLTKKEITFFSTFFKGSLNKTLIGIGTVASILGLLQFFWFKAMGPGSSTIIPYVLLKIGNYRVTGPFGQPNLFALLLLVCLLAFYYLYLEQNEFKLVHAVPFLLICTVFFLTQSRSGQLALLVLLVLIYLIYLRNKSKSSQEWRRSIRLLFVLFCGYALFALLLNWAPQSGENIRSITDTSYGTDARFVMWTAAIMMFLENPLLGVGLGNYKQYLPEKLLPAHDFLGFVEYEALPYTKWAHNEFLHFIAEGGVLVLILFLFFFWHFSKCILKKNKTKEQVFSLFFLVPFIVQSCFSWPLHFTALAFLCVLFLVQWYIVWFNPVTIAVKWRGLWVAILCIFSITVFAYGSEQWRMARAADDISSGDYRQKVDMFIEYSKSSFTPLAWMEKMTPAYLSYVQKNDDRQTAIKIYPIVKRLAYIEGFAWQYYNLAILQRYLGLRELAVDSAIKSTQRNPVFEPAWKLWHLLNYEEKNRILGLNVKDGISERDDWDYTPEPDR